MSWVAVAVTGWLLCSVVVAYLIALSIRLADRTADDTLDADGYVRPRRPARNVSAARRRADGAPITTSGLRLVRDCVSEHDRAVRRRPAFDPVTRTGQEPPGRR